MLIAQLSDLHLVAAGERLFARVDTAAALRAAVDRLNQLKPAPALVVVSGDLVNDGRREQYEHLRQQLDRLAIRYCLMPGNHDERGALRAVFTAQDFTGNPLLCQRTDLADLSLLLLDTTIPGQEGGEFADAQAAWLDAACPADRPAILFVHHPPFPTGIRGMDAIRLAGAERLADWLSRHRQVRALAAGHVHRMVFAQFAGIPAMTSPATGMQVALELDADAELSYTLEPGGFLVHRWDGEHLATHVMPIAPAARYQYGSGRPPA